MAIDYNKLKLSIAFITFILASHWIACVWALLAVNEDLGDEDTWLMHAAPANGVVPAGPMEIYLTSLYWSSMTVTSVGYGDILPVTTLERTVCTLLMFVSGFVWAYALGEMMAAFGNSDVHEQNFRHMLDDLNHMMADRSLPAPLRSKMRAFFFQIKDLSRVQGYKDIVERLSPLLQGELAVTVNRVWLRKVWYFNAQLADLPRDFLAGLAVQLQVEVHTQQECFGEPWTLYILLRGLCVRSMRVHKSGSVWGEDFILASRQLLDTTRAFCLTFVELSSMTRDDFTKLVRRHPEVWQSVRWAVVRMAVKSAVVRESRRRKKAVGIPSAKTFMEFSFETEGRDPSPDTGFPLGGRQSEQTCDLAEVLQDVSAKQAQMQQQCSATQERLQSQLTQIQRKLDAMLHETSRPSEGSTTRARAEG